MRVLYASHNLVIRGYGFDSKISRALGLKFRTGHILQIITNTSQLSFIQQGKNKIKLWELTIRVAVSVFYMEREGPQDYASGVAIRSWN